MREYTIARIPHTVYDDTLEVPNDIKVVKDWRTADIGEWVLADDGGIIQIIRSGMMKQRKRLLRYVGTCTGTFVCLPNVKMDTSKKRNIYSFGGNNNHLDSITKRKKVTAQEVVFAKYIAIGLPPAEAYKKAFHTKNEKYAKVRAGVLIKQERIVSAVKEELEGVFKELGIDLKYLVKGVKAEADGADRTLDRLKAFQMLWEAADVVPKNKVTQVTGAVFQGFEDDQLLTAKRPELIEGKKGASKEKN
jgi:hypothetical protein